MSSVSKVAAHTPERATARTGSSTAPERRDARGTGQRSDGISIGVILGFPTDVAEELQRWRASFGDPMAAIIPAHITLVTTTMTQDWDATRDHVRTVASRQAPFTVTIAGTGSFRPVSPVVFLNVEDGFDDCVSLHRELQSGPLERELPFAYHPHVTVAHDVAPESLDEAETALKDYSATFPVASMGLYEHDDNGIWQLREELDFGTEPDHHRGEDGAAGAR
ncbi:MULTISPECIES: 2'-5' RNA ligase family protein [unclassified Arthrobacter]|uniref:2'-5' RNA ligase family protein n=1 Tax=unclassified Arthrobacter TaxID=235627 RepID=UPI002DFEE9C1|nr:MULTISPECIES: 2'-5' RNA ligase family protein [unclassified Arthrobacter]MEC5190282.1 2'-5' RNA ligase [Arthrobacter sp. MP_M4]MEC5202655.1 2'-5' RNA ligase [Arthrobacter sp. MP_M7]